MKELRELKAEVVAVEERVRAPPQAQNISTLQPMRQAPLCRTCQQSGNGWLCNHFFRCGASGHCMCEFYCPVKPTSSSRISGKRSEVTPVGQDLTGQDNQYRCVQCRKQGPDFVPLKRCGACKTSRYCLKGCQNGAKIRTQNGAKISFYGYTGT